MTTTISSISLVGGQQVRFTFEATGASTAVNMTVFDSSGAVLRADGPFDAGSTFQADGSTLASRIDSFAAAPLRDGSFAYVSAKHFTVSGIETGPDQESLFVVRLNATGVQATGLGGGRIGFDLPITGIEAPDPDFTTAPTIMPLSGDHFAVFWNGLIGTTPINGVDVLLDDPFQTTHIVLPTQPVQVLRGGAADLQLILATGDQVLIAGGDHTSLQGGAANDSIVGIGVADTLFGGDGNDSITGGSAFDRTNGNAGNDTVQGNGGDDWVTGGKNDDVLLGGLGNDILNGNLGGDTADGGAGADVVRGGQGDDLLSGGDGDDFLAGDLGNDTLTGGAGADTFRAFNGGGQDRIIDFNAAEGDRVQLDPGTTFTVSQVGADTVIDLGGDHQTVLVGVQLASLPAAWIFGA